MVEGKIIRRVDSENMSQAEKCVQITLFTPLYLWGPLPTM